LDQLAEVDPALIHIDNPIEPGQSPQVEGMKRVMALPEIADVDYLLHCDSDEFLQIKAGKGQLEDLVRVAGASDCIALLWRPFGDSGHKTWPGGLVLENFVQAARYPRTARDQFKCLFRPSRFEGAIDHMPKYPVSEDVTLTNAKGMEMPTGSLFHPKRARFRESDRSHYTWRRACMHHYAIRSEDVFLMKNLRGDGMGTTHQKYYLNSKFWRRNNANKVTVEPDSAVVQAVKSRVEDMRQVGTVAQLERDALDWFTAQRDKYLTPEQIKALTL
jgi:hypothetical protein